MAQQMWQKSLNYAWKTAFWKIIKVLFFNNKGQMAQIINMLDH